MPVVSIELNRFAKLVGSTREQILSHLPYIGLDIESVAGDIVRVEYSPNRPDFGTDYGIARALKGLLGKELGLPDYPLHRTGITVMVDMALSRIRPHIACSLVSGLTLDEEDIRQLISLQEDIHNGLGRMRRKVAIGLHDFRLLKPPILYEAVSPSFTFVPLEMKRAMSLDQILRETEVGRKYAFALGKSSVYPVLRDSRGTVLSFPPIINGNKTKVTPATKNIFVDVTSTERKAGDEALAIFVSSLAEMGGRVGTVVISSGSEKRLTPDLKPGRMRLDSALVRSVTGLDLTPKKLVQCLRKSRMEVKGNTVLYPRYRVDILHPVDLAEEVALGYGVETIPPLYPASEQAGNFSPLVQFLDRVSDIMTGSGMLEVMNYELTDETSLYTNFQRKSEDKLEVENSRSKEHSVLRDSLLPSLMSILARNVKEEYPQKLFEIGRVYLRSGDGVSEEWRLAALSAHANAGYTEAKMYLEAFCRVSVGSHLSTKAASHWAFTEGRSAEISIKGKRLGYVGEVKPEALQAFKVSVPVAGFEISLEPLARTVSNS